MNLAARERGVRRAGSRRWARLMVGLTCET